MDILLQLDRNILLFIQECIRQDWMDGFWKGITTLGNSAWFWIVASMIMLIFKKTRKVGATALLGLAIGALLTNVLLKNLVERIRPYEVIDGLTILIEKQHDFSFPSGHTCASFAAAVVYFRTLPKKWGIPAVVLASLIGLSRLYVGVHYPSDVLAGFVVGCLGAFLAVWLIEKLCPSSDKPNPPAL